MVEIRVESRRKNEYIDLTGRLREAVAANRWRGGILFAFVPHTTAGIFINENADPDVLGDLERFSGRLVPGSFPWRHAEGNSPGHVKSVLYNPFLYLFVEESLVLGTWQGVFFAEFDGPRTRRVLLRFMPGMTEPGGEK